MWRFDILSPLLFSVLPLLLGVATDFLCRSCSKSPLTFLNCFFSISFSSTRWSYSEPFALFSLRNCSSTLWYFAHKSCTVFSDADSLAIKSLSEEPLISSNSLHFSSSPFICSFVLCISRPYSASSSPLLSAIFS